MNGMVETALTALATVAGVATLPGTLELALLTAAAALPPARARRGDPAAVGELVTVVPAHDEEASIAACVDSLRAAYAYAGRAAADSIVVVADNCSDATATAARAAGARVIERCDPAHRGKGPALA